VVWIGLHELDMALLTGPQRQFQPHDLAIEDADHAHGHVWHDAHLGAGEGRSRHHGRFGGTRTDRDRHVSRNGSEDSPKVDQLARSIPVGRIGQPDDVARAVLFFSSRDSDFITGQALYVCGGASVGSIAL